MAGASSTFGHLRVRFVSGESLSWYSNINTIREYRRFITGDPSGLRMTGERAAAGNDRSRPDVSGREPADL